MKHFCIIFVLICVSVTVFHPEAVSSGEKLGPETVGTMAYEKDESTHADFKRFYELKKTKYGAQYESFSPDALMEFEAEEVREFKGCSGEEAHFECVVAVDVTLQFKTDGSIVGESVVRGTNIKRNLIGQMYLNGSILLKEILEPHGIGYIFNGIYKDGKIMGLWEKGSGKKGYEFSVQVQ